MRDVVARFGAALLMGGLIAPVAGGTANTSRALEVATESEGIVFPGKTSVHDISFRDGIDTAFSRAVNAVGGLDHIAWDEGSRSEGEHSRAIASKSFSRIRVEDAECEVLRLKMKLSNETAEGKIVADKFELTVDFDRERRPLRSTDHDLRKVDSITEIEQAVLLVLLHVLEQEIPPTWLASSTNTVEFDSISGEGKREAGIALESSPRNAALRRVSPSEVAVASPGVTKLGDGERQERIVRAAFWAEALIRRVVDQRLQSAQRVG